MSDISNETLKKQKHTLIAVGSGLALLALGFLYFTSEDTPYQPSQTQAKKSADLPLDKVNVNDIWMSKLEKENQLLDQRFKYLEEVVLNSKKNEEAQELEKNRLKEELFNLRKELQSKSQASALADNGNDSPFGTGFDLNESMGQRGFLQEVVMEEKPREKVLNVEKMIPAGSTVKAVLVSSADVPCGVFSTSDPYPIKLRIIDDAHLPNSVRVKLKGGIILASAYGSLSSERILIRLERLTQTKPDGSFVETAVTGFVSGEDGKYGIRGVVVDKSGDLIANAAVSGFFEGVSEYLQSTVNVQNVARASRGLPSDVKWDMLKAGGLQGTDNALDKLAEYYIKRAEQLQPVIQVASGRIVDITFSHGTDIGDLHTKDKIKQVRDEYRQGGI